MNQNDIEAMIQRYTEAEMAVLDGKSVTFNGQQMTMENLSEIRQGRQEWERRLAALITRRRGHADWKTTTQGQKSVGDTSATLAWRPGDSGQKKLVQLFDSGEVCAFRIKYPNGTVDVFRGWLSSLGKTIASKDVMTRTVKISGVGRPYLAEEGTETVSVTGLTVSPASASVKVGATTTLTFTVKPDGASDKAISVHSSDPQTATVTLNGLVATVKGVKQGSVSIVGMTADGNFVAVTAVTVSAAG